MNLFQELRLKKSWSEIEKKLREMPSNWPRYRGTHFWMNERIFKLILEAVPTTFPYGWRPQSLKDSTGPQKRIFARFSQEFPSSTISDLAEIVRKANLYRQTQNQRKTG